MFGQIWSALASLGSGLIFFAVAAGGEWWLAAPLIVLALLEIGYGLAVLRAGRVVAPRAAITGSVVAMLVAFALLFTSTIGFVPAIAVIGLHWVIAVIAALVIRRRHSDDAAASRAPRPGAFALSMTVAALVVSAVTTPALANTGPGEFAVPHGTLHQHH
ncbi:hypothetical protein GCM10009847_16610 [Leucobacter tardus]|uniref:Uncharacterized protein n=1 Tax=Leucobacter tardus TaxID=501483 RepID=A0A939TNR8_9MICO|nr:hypothetical protein [Leucobacter tardus]MBO2990823.1 hypothetical protein [Leucobacter tardus]